MIRGFGKVNFSTYSQTFNRSEYRLFNQLGKAVQEKSIPSGPFLVSRTGDAGWTERSVKVAKWSFIRNHKGCSFLLTAGMWSWKLKSSKECVTTHLPKKAVPKMDAAEMIDRYRSFPLQKKKEERVGGREDSEQVSTWVGMEGSLVRILVEVATIQTDNFEDWSGERFQSKCIFLWVIRS